MSDYKDAFINEAREQLDNLSDGLLLLEKEPDNTDYINQVFRACHTLKGNAAMMGYNTFSKLSHSMENVLAKMRDGSLKANEDIINSLFDGADMLEHGLETIDAHEADLSDTDDLIHKFDVISEKKQELTHENTNLPMQLGLDDGQKHQIWQAKEEGYHVFRVTIIFKPTCLLKGPKAMVLLRDNKDIMERIIYAHPSIDDIRNGKVTSGVDLVIGTKISKDELIERMNKVSEVESRVLDPEENYSIPTHIDPAKSQIKKDIVRTFSKPIQSIRVDVKKLDNLVNMVGELLIANMQLKQISKESNQANLSSVTNSIEILTTNIQEEVMQERMVPVGQIFNRFPRLVRDLSMKENKKLIIEIKGEEIELDRNVLDEISEPLIHIIRNAVDHGIEKSDERIRSGKNIEGKIRLTATREKNSAMIVIEDDGGGINTAKVVQKAINSGLVTESEARSMSRQKMLSLIFTPGLSTKDQITDISGRGVGMDVVLTKIKRLGGNVKIHSKEGLGTRIELSLPLTLAIISSLIVRVEGDKYALPLSSIIETIDLQHKNIKTIQGNEIILLRGQEVPLVRLSSFFYAKRKDLKEYAVVITEEGDRKVGFIVDEIVDQQPILIKNLHKLIRGVKGIAGATILGDGKVCLIADVSSIGV
ncbi:chemotaxis protein CheA [Candidatus Woesearchaeota archaeon]|nr:chemotaxis protein CheA [Candidatus Woesearchaeota archaeon]